MTFDVTSIHEVEISESDARRLADVVRQKYEIEEGGKVYCLDIVAEAIAEGVVDHPGGEMLKAEESGYTEFTPDEETE